MGIYLEGIFTSKADIEDDIHAYRHHDISLSSWSQDQALFFTAVITPWDFETANRQSFLTCISFPSPYHQNCPTGWQYCYSLLNQFWVSICNNIHRFKSWYHHCCLNRHMFSQTNISFPSLYHQTCPTYWWYRYNLDHKIHRLLMLLQVRPQLSTAKFQVWVPTPGNVVWTLW